MSRKVVVLHANGGEGYQARLVTMIPNSEGLEEDGDEVIGEILRIRDMGNAGLVANTRAARWAAELGVPYIG